MKLSTYILLSIAILCTGATALYCQTEGSTDIEAIKTMLAQGTQLSPAEKAFLESWKVKQTPPEKLHGPTRDDRSEEPDAFGYRWVDDEEEDGPEFDWLEIEDWDGVQAFNFIDDSNSGPIDLGFAFPFYDREFETVRMCSNGWASFTNAGNRWGNDNFRLPGGDIENMLAVAFSDWYPPAGGQFLFWTDDEMAILSWVNVPHINDNNIIWSYQIILYANGRIIYQYLRMNGRQDDVVVGIQNQDANIGLEIVNNRGGYMREGLAIKIQNAAAWVTGTVTELGSDTPIEGAHILLSDGTETMTDEDGIYWLNEVGDGDFTLEVSRFGFNSLVSDEFTLEDEDTLVMDFAMPHPEIRLSVEPEDGFNARLDPNESTEDEFTISNDGNGELQYNMHFTIPAQRDNPGDLFFDWDLFDITGDERIHGICTPDGETFYLTGENTRAEPNYIYVLNRVGELMERFEQPVLNPTNVGMRAIVTDGTYLYAADGRDITQFTTFGERIGIIPGIPAVSPIINIAYDPETDHFFISNVRTDIFEIDRNGNLINRIDVDLRIGGLAWHPEDLDGYNLYVQHEITDGPPEMLSKINIHTGEMMDVFEFNTGGGDREGDQIENCTITNQFNPSVWMLLTIVTNNRIEHAVGVELELNTTWVEIEPMFGTVEPNSEVDVSVGFNTEGWTPGLYELILLIDHNTVEEQIQIPVSLNITNEGLEPEYFEFSENNISQTMTVGSLTIRGRRAEFGDEVGFFDRDGTCAGAGLWLNQATTFTIYGDNPDTDFDEGYDENEEFDVRIWDADIQIEFEGEFLVTQGDRIFTANGNTRGNASVAGFVREIDYPVSVGWSLVSTNLDPDNVDVEFLFAEMVGRGTLELLKNAAGDFYRPQIPINNIEGWDYSQGYLVKTNQADHFRMTGVYVAPDTPIDLIQGWNIVSYYPTWEIGVREAFASLENRLIIVKDGLGRFYSTAYNFSNMPPLTAGNGYYVKVSEASELTYPSDDVESLDPRYYSAPPLKHIAMPRATGHNMSLLVTNQSLLQDSEFAVLGSDGSVYGAARVDLANQFGIAVWGDDPTTELIDGAVEGENLRLAVWHDGKGLVDVGAIIPDGKLEYSTNSFKVIELTGFNTGLPTELILTGAYPNPFNDRTTVRFTLPTQGEITLTVYDLEGRQVASLAEGVHNSGLYAVPFDAHGLSAGTYFIKLNTAFGQKYTKVILLK